MKTKTRGFTIVELLIVIVVIAILAAISIVAYNGIQARAKDSQRKSDVATINKALELYYAENNEYPRITNSGSLAGGSWSLTADLSWRKANTNVDGTWMSLESALVPKYISKLPGDPTNTQAVNITSAPGYGYFYYGNIGASCGAAVGQMYILVYKLEGEAQVENLQGDCSTAAVGPYALTSEYRVRR